MKCLTCTKIPKLQEPTPGRPSQRWDVIGSIGATTQFGFGQVRFRGYKELAANKRYPDTLKALIEYGNLVVPQGFRYNFIQVNRGVKAKKHIDKKNVGDSVIVGIGDYTGGRLRVYKNDTEYTAFDLKDKPVLFNGAERYHETEDFEGERYTFIYLTQRKKGAEEYPWIPGFEGQTVGTISHDYRDAGDSYTRGSVDGGDRNTSETNRREGSFNELATQ